MNIDSSVYDIDVEFGKLNCGDTFIYMSHLYIKAILLHSEPTEYCAVKLCDGESRCVIDVETVKLVKTKAEAENVMVYKLKPANGSLMFEPVNT